MYKILLRAARPMVIVFILNTVINDGFGLYDRWWWYDIPMHMLGGFVTAWSLSRFIFFLKIKSKIIALPPLFHWLLIIGTTAIAGIGWEVYEYFLHIVTGRITQPSVGDTLQDLINGLIGAILFFLFARKTKNKFFIV
jgi:hypothetical protein